jgi:hypothetical protein
LVSRRRPHGLPEGREFFFKLGDAGRSCILLGLRHRGIKHKIVFFGEFFKADLALGLLLQLDLAILLSGGDSGFKSLQLFTTLQELISMMAKLILGFDKGTGSRTKCNLCGWQRLELLFLNDFTDPGRDELLEGNPHRAIFIKA